MPTRAFAADPRQFMRDNIILASAVADQDSTTNTLRLFKLVQKPGVVIQNRYRKGVYELQDSADGEVNFAAYWCPYTANNHLSAFLRADAKCMFTAVMDGCSFGIGSANANGERMVFHANRERYGREQVPQATSKDTVQQRMDTQVVKQNRALGKRNVSAGNVIDPTWYGGNKGRVISYVGMANIKGYAMKYKSTTVGLRFDDSGWQFFTLRYRILSRTLYLHGGLKQFTTGD